MHRTQFWQEFLNRHHPTVLDFSDIEVSHSHVSFALGKEKSNGLIFVWKIIAQATILFHPSLIVPLAISVCTKQPSFEDLPA